MEDRKKVGDRPLGVGALETSGSFVEAVGSATASEPVASTKALMWPSKAFVEANSFVEAGSALPTAGPGSFVEGALPTATKERGDSFFGGGGGRFHAGSL